MWKLWISVVGLGLAVATGTARGEIGLAVDGAACAGSLVVEVIVGKPLAAPAPLVRPGLMVEAAVDATGGEGVPAGDLSAVRLAGVVLPVAAGGSARSMLEAALVDVGGAPAMVHAASARRDRHGRVAGQVVLAAGDGERWLQRRLVAAGLVMASEDGGACLPALLAVEAGARAARRGIWADPDLVRRALPADPAGLPDHVVMEGVVRSVGKTAGTTYLNFGGRYRTDTTVRLSRDVLAGLPAGEDPEGWVGRKVRVRGMATAEAGVDLAPSTLAAIEWLQ